MACPSSLCKSCTEHVSPKSRLVALLLCWFLGFFGGHRFYVGKVGTGLLMLFTCGGLGIWWLIDFIIIIVGSFRDKSGRVLFQWFEGHSMGCCPKCGGATLTG